MSCSWVKREIYGPVPAPRQGHAVALVGKSAYIFGGSSGSGYGEHDISSSDPVYLNDLFHLKVSLQVTWERMRQLGDVPCARDGHTLSSVGSVLYLIGGSNFPEAEESLEGLYAYDIGTLSWEMCLTQGSQPRALGHSTASVGDTLYVFGGIYHGEAKNSLHMLNTGNLTWTLLKTSGQCPSPRCDHDCTVIGEKFYICGGSGGEAVWYNDLYCFDTVTLVWYYINAQGHLPHPRSLHSISAHHDKDIYLFGGANDSPSCKVRSPFGDIYKFSLSKMKWKKLHCEGTAPDRRLGHTACIVYGQLLIFGGMNDEKDYNDLVILQTRAAAKQLPPAMTADASLQDSSFSSVASSSSCSSEPFTSYDTIVPIPAKYQMVTSSLNQPTKAPNFDNIKATFISRIDDIFADLSAKYGELEMEKAALRTSVENFQEERESNILQYEEQQKELQAMLVRHKEENEEWIQERKQELAQERRDLDKEKAKLQEEKDKFIQEQNACKSNGV